MPDLAWQNVINSFSKARISKGRQNSTLLDHDDPIKGFQEQIKKVTIQITVTNFYPNGTTTEDTILVKEMLLTTETLFMGED